MGRIAIGTAYAPLSFRETRDLGSREFEIRTPKVDSDTTWAKSSARRAPDAILNSGRLRMGGVRSIIVR